MRAGAVAAVDPFDVVQVGDLLSFADGRFRVQSIVDGDLVMMSEVSSHVERRIRNDRLSQLRRDGDVVLVRDTALAAQLTLNVKRDDLFEFETGRYRFSRELGNRVMLLVNESTGHELQLAEETLIKLIDEQRVTRIEWHSDADGRIIASNDNDDVPPDMENTDLVMRARTFKFYVDLWDKDPDVGLGEKGLQEFISRYRKRARENKCLWDVKPARLKFAIKNCGLSGHRPLRMFLSRQGKVKRQRLPKALERLMVEAVKFYWSERKRDYNDAFAHLKSLIREENRQRRDEGREPLVSPSRSETLRRRINEAECHLTWETKFSRFEADDRFRGTSESLKANRPGELVIIDHTTLDNWTLFDDIAGLPLGRLTLTVAIDVATRCILGFLISAEPPSLYSVLTVLKKVNKPKSYVADLYPAIEGQWDSWCHVEELLVDNGWEFLSPSFQDALADIGTKVKWAPIHTPAFKAVGERFFGTLNSMLIHKLPNSVPFDPKTMSALRLDPTKDMVVRLSDLERLVHQCVIEVYEQETHSGIRAIPARIWREKIAKHKRRFIDDVKSLDILLARVDDVVVTRSGVRFKNMDFHDQVGVSEILNDNTGHMPKRSQTGKRLGSARVKTKAKWNPEDCSRIHVFNAEVKSWVTLHNTDERFTQNLSFWHADQIFKFMKEQDLDYRSEDERWAARDRLRAEWEKLAPAKPRRTGADARRGMAQEQAKLAEGVVDVRDAQPTTDGWDRGDGIPNTVPHFDRLDNDTIVSGARRGGKAATKKATETRQRKAREREDIDRWSNDVEEETQLPKLPKPAAKSVSNVRNRTSWGKS
jgi:putative transposase